MQDSYGRKITYLRISLTDKCNLRCRYCMPPEGVPQLSHSEILSLEEVSRVAGLLTEMGIDRIRLTGGEPLVRRGIGNLIRELYALPAKPKLALTTNGVLLADRLEAFAAAGLRSVNISLDTRDPETFRKLTGVDRLEQVERAIDRAVSLGFSVKLNCVPIRGINDGELAALAEYAREREIAVRFIELMPIGCAGDFRGVSRAELLELLEKEFGRAELPGRSESAAPEKENVAPSGKKSATPSGMERDNESSDTSSKMNADGPAEYVHFPGFKGDVGFISPLSHTFCDKCNRIRLTASGQLKLCLYYPDGLDVKKLIRGGCTDEELKEEIRRAVLAKPKCHNFTDRQDAGNKEQRTMNQIGG